VVPEVPLAGESVARHGTVAAVVRAQEGLVTVAVHGVGLTLVAKEARRGREPGVLAGLVLAPVGLEVRVDELAVKGRAKVSD
jgi:hypothetical protein